MTTTIEVLSYLVAACLTVLTVFIIVKAVQTLIGEHSWAYKCEKLLRLAAVLVGMVGTFGLLAFGAWLASHPLMIANGHPRYSGVSYHTQHRVFFAALVVAYSSILFWMMAIVISYFRNITERNPIINLDRVFD